MTIKADDFAPIGEQASNLIKMQIKSAPFSKLVGLSYDEIRCDYACMRLRYKPELNQPAGVIHGGAIASLIDTSVVAAVFSGAPTMPKSLLTIDMHIHYLDVGVEEDLLAYAAVRRRGHKVVFLQSEVVGADSGKAIAHGELSYMLKYAK